VRSSLLLFPRRVRYALINFHQNFVGRPVASGDFDEELFRFLFSVISCFVSVRVSAHGKINNSVDVSLHIYARFIAVFAENDVFHTALCFFATRRFLHNKRKLTGPHILN